MGDASTGASGGHPRDAAPALKPEIKCVQFPLMKRFVFRWVPWNLDHATKHGVSVTECERVVLANRYRQTEGGKFRAVGRGNGGRWLQVVFALTVDDEVFVIHARPLTESEKHRERRK
jgi:uncharacterized DUF497 family protein